MREQRRLAAIVAADIAGYSRLMGGDESGTLASLKAVRRDVVDPRIAEHGGRIVKTTGDGLLLEFPSVVDAVRCAVEVQTAMAVETAHVAENRRLAFRIGVNLGDIIIDGDDIFGDGVNVAARLEAISEPGGICLSDDVWRQVRGKLDLACRDGGVQSLKNIAEPIKTWRWSPGRPIASPSPPALSLPDKPSIAVLPFQNMSGDPEQEYFADGIVEDILTALARFKALFVIARNSSFTYKGKAIDIKQVGRELGVRYVLEGSVRKAGGRVRVTAQLIDASEGQHVWAERFDRLLEDIFVVQEEITSRIVGAVAPEIEASEIGRVRRSTDLGAYDKAMMATARYWTFLTSGDRAAGDNALHYARAALAIDSQNLRALNILSATRIHQVIMGWAEDFDAAWSEGMQAASMAIEAERADSEGYRSKGTLLIYAKDADRIDEAMINLRRAHALNPHSASVLFALALGEICAGDPASTIAHAIEALRLSPRDPLKHALYLMVSMGHFCLENYTEGVKFAQLGISESQANASLYAHLAVNLMGLGRQEEAVAAVAEMRRASAVFADRALAGRMQYRNPEYLRRSTTFLRRAAGVDKPEVPPATPALTLPDKPSIAVLPFQNMSGDPEQEYFADGIVEDIITALSRFKSLFVIARNSSFTYKGRAVDIKQVGRELGVRYVLEGSVRKAGGRVRITGQLIEAATGAHLWADRFDGSWEDIFGLQDQITARVVGAMAPKIDAAELARGKRKPVESLDAYDCVLRALPLRTEYNRQANEQLLKLIYRAMELDPDYSTPYGVACRCIANIKLYRWGFDPAIHGSEIRRLADRIRLLGQDDAYALAVAGFCLVWVCGEHDLGMSFVDKAVNANPNLAQAWTQRGGVALFCGDHDEAMKSFEIAARISPLGTDFYLNQGYVALAHLFRGDYPRAIAAAAIAISNLPTWLVPLLARTAAEALAGNATGAAKSLAQLRSLNPDLRPSTIDEAYPYQAEDMARLRDGLRLAGLPE